MSIIPSVLTLVLYFLAQFKNVTCVDYGSSLTKSILFFEAQRSGKLPPNQRVQWRADSALKDGQANGVNLVGGYYDAGDNVKFGFPMAYTITMLSWGVVEFGPELRAGGELENALAAIKWGTDYFIKAHPEPEVLYGQVGDGHADHACWQRPEEMTTPRPAYKIDAQHPGADLAGETAAAMAAASIAFKKSNPRYSSTLLTHAKQLFEFAKKHPGLYQSTIPAGEFYSSSGYEDELLWAAAWLERATNDKRYLEHIQSSNSGGTKSMFSWDDKYIGAQTLIAKGLFEKRYPNNGNLGQYKDAAEQFICNVIQKGSNNVQKTNDGLLWFLEFDNLQYVTSAAFIVTSYADTLAKARSTLRCTAGIVQPKDLMNVVKSQIDYILGENSKRMSYMVGYGSNYPKQVHHRGASIPSIKKLHKITECSAGFNEFMRSNQANPNILEGAIVGGPDKSGQYVDNRENYKQAEPATGNNAPIVGVLAALAHLKRERLLIF